MVTWRPFTTRLGSPGSVMMDVVTLPVPLGGTNWGTSAAVWVLAVPLKVAAATVPWCC